jgi:hypothetical protein
VTKHRGKAHTGPAHASPYPVSRLSAPHDLVDLALEIQRADAVLAAGVGGKLEAIARQIVRLQAEAREALEQARRDAELHRARCRFRKRAGQCYHLYDDGELYFSMLSPEDWHGAPPHAYRGSYRLEADMRWTPLDEVDAREAEQRELRALLPGVAPDHEGAT